jgi:alpha-D-ribose 1-methylphosphonate 5-triphosphate diphosphatase
MSTETVLTNARLVLEDRIIRGSLVIRDGVIAEIAEGNSANGLDMEGRLCDPRACRTAHRSP